MEWQPFERSSPPTSSGLYAIKSADRWLYIGKAKNIARRIRYHHPIPLTEGLSMPIVLLWWAVSDGLGKAEAAAIRTLRPEWNGSTWQVPFAGNAHGIYCEWSSPEALRGIWD
jgi:excinuclease UvrABC nuclease subunit